MTEPSERMVHLLLSPKAAAALDETLEDSLLNTEWPGSHNQILTAIRRDISDQLPQKGKSKKGRKK